MSKVVFETAALADALGKAARVAPTRGTAFERSAGIYLDITATEAIVMATDDMVRFSTWLTPEAFEGDQVKWRVPSAIFANVISKLKVSQSRTISLEQDHNSLKLQHGKTRAVFRLMDADYPTWMPFSPDDMQEVVGLSKAVSQVVWAAAKNGDPPLIAVHLDGKLALATDRYKFASAPCELPLADPITVPPAALTGILKTTGSVMMRIEGSQVYIMPDEFTQIALTAYGVDYPPIQTLMRDDYPITVKVNKQQLMDSLELTMTMIGADRDPTIVLILGKEQVAAMITNREVGLVGHVVEVPGQLSFDKRHEVRFNPDNLLGALNASPGAEVTLGLDPDKPFGPFLVNGGGEGIKSWLAPRKKMEEE